MIMFTFNLLLSLHSISYVFFSKQTHQSSIFWTPHETQVFRCNLSITQPSSPFANSKAEYLLTSSRHLLHITLLLTLSITIHVVLDCLNLNHPKKPNNDQPPQIHLGKTILQSMLSNGTHLRIIKLLFQLSILYLVTLRSTCGPMFSSIIVSSPPHHINSILVHLQNSIGLVIQWQIILRFRRDIFEVTQSIIPIHKRFHINPGPLLPKQCIFLCIYIPINPR